MAIKRNISVTNEGIIADINIVYGTNMLPIEFYITDYVLPDNAIPVLYCTTSGGELFKTVGTIVNDVISFNTAVGFFTVGKNRSQIRITANEKEIYSFEVNVNCKPNMASDDAQETEDQPTLVTQLLNDVSVLSARLDEALSIPEGGTTADAALNDIKVGYDGTVYDTPGNAVREQVEEAHERINANSIISTAQGETILVTDSAKVPPENIKLFGKTTQVPTEGNQLLSIPDKVENRNGLTFDVKNGVCTIKGTTTADTLCWFLGGYDNSNTIFTLPPGNYYIKDCRIWSFDGTTRVNKTGALTLTENFNVTGVYTETYTSGTVVNTTIYPMINKGLAALPFEPYTGGKPSPSIDYPQELNSCGDDGNIVGKILTGNMLKYSVPKNYTETKNGVTLTILDDGGIKLSGTNTNSGETEFPVVKADYLLPDGEYTISIKGMANNMRISTWNNWSPFWYVNGTPECFVTTKDAVGTGTMTNCTPRINITVGTNATVNCTIYIMFNFGNTALEYEPYSEQSFIVSTPNGLPGIPVSDTSIANYIDETGQAWVSDYVDFERGKLVHMVAQEIIEGTPAFSETSDLLGRFLWVNAITKTYKSPEEKSLSNFGKYSRWGIPNNQTRDIFSIGSAIAKSIYYTPFEPMTADEVNAKFAEMIASDNPPVIVGQLAEPFETDLTTEELAQYNALCMNYPNTTITNDSEAYTEVEYVASPKEYIANLEKKHDNDIQQLKTAIIALGGTI